MMYSGPFNKGCKNLRELKVKITATFNNKNREIVEKVYSIFRSHLEALLEANGDFIE